MQLPKFAARRRGFTLIELLIVIVVIAILALIVIPRLMGAARKAKESTLKANLHQVRNALEMFQADTGVYPSASNLADLVAPANSTSGGGLTTTGIPDGTYKGPYLNAQSGIISGTAKGIPLNPFVSSTETDVTKHWTYSTAGEVHPANAGTGLDPATAYSTW